MFKFVCNCVVARIWDPILFLYCLLEFRIIFYISLIGRMGAWGRNISSPRDTPGFGNQQSSVSESHT